MTPGTSSAPLFDPFAPGFTDDPYPQYAAVREAAPMYEHPLGFWLLTRYEDVAWLLRAGGLSMEDRNVISGVSWIVRPSGAPIRSIDPRPLR